MAKFFTAMFRPLIRYFNFSGRANRMEFAAFALLLIILELVLFFALRTSPQIYGMASIAKSAFFLIPGLAVQVRRLHDMSYSGKTLIYYYFVAPLIVGAFALFGGLFQSVFLLMVAKVAIGIVGLLWLYLMCLMYFKRGDTYKNQYGDVPA